jgi:hypothetical protein
VTEPTGPPASRFDVVGWPTPGDERGLYLYGIIRRAGAQAATSPAAEGSAESGSDADAGSALLVVQGDLAAVVRTAQLAEFDPEEIRRRAEDPAWLAAAVQRHNAVIAAVHETRAILPARFGSVYASAEDLSATLAASHDRLLTQLDRLEGCDEWGIHVYADRARVEARVVAEDPALRDAMSEIGTASTGRAYFLRRKLLDQVADATDRALAALAQSVFDSLLRLAVDGDISPPAVRSPEGDADTEILRAAFLVRRAARQDFLAAVEALADEAGELHCERTGPWPPYSFAVPVDEAER